MLWYALRKLWTTPSYRFALCFDEIVATTENTVEYGLSRGELHLALHFIFSVTYPLDNPLVVLRLRSRDSSGPIFMSFSASIFEAVQVSRKVLNKWV